MGGGSSVARQEEISPAIAQATDADLQMFVAGLGVAEKEKLVAALSETCPVSHKTAAEGKCPFQDIVKKTTGAVAPKVPEIVADFYQRLFQNNPQTKAFFNPANQFADPPLQRLALGNAGCAYASNIDNLGALTGAVGLIAQKHCALGVLPEHYPIVHDNLMASIAHVLGDAVTPEVGQGWSEAVMSLAKILIDTEEGLYKQTEQRGGGWRGSKDFTVAIVRKLTENMAEVTFEPADGCTTPIDFTPGQYTTVFLKRDGATPRHYTVVSKPGAGHLQICVKKLPGGFVSKGVHELKEGDVVGLAAPFGSFHLKEGKGAVLVSAGIGVTPMRSFLASHSSDVRMVLHVDKDEARHPYRDEFVAAGVTHKFIYTTNEKDGRPSQEALMAELKHYVKDCASYVCGPPACLDTVNASLKEAGAEVYIEAFGPALAPRH